MDFDERQLRAFLAITETGSLGRAAALVHLTQPSLSRMIQSMEVLQMPLAQLQERVEQELERNVALEQVEPDASQVAQPTSEDPPEEEPVERPLTVGETGADFERARAFEREFNEVTTAYATTLGGRPDLLSGEPTDESINALRQVGERAKQLTSGTPGQINAARGLAASVDRTTAAIEIARAKTILAQKRAQTASK